ncbi:vomeronasal type-1 receptor 4-like [Dipodomys spectabilis]|uniref:vomeronasal type-1 receptor 4-like n=1 Tax=Dipodomys spectabilis TaxID=105255 RepID=UPI001C545226|nr:vomeronasal type-1 receptor 4-like [Dipodomys spectabilis]
MRATDLILRHLIVANFLSLLCRGVPQTMVAWGWRNFFNDVGCKMVFYLYRVCRGVSIGSTCSLSIFIALGGLPLGEHCFSHVHDRPKAHYNMTSLNAYGYCSSVIHDPAADVLYVAMLSVPDVLCLGLMLWASTSTLFVLYRHKQRMGHMQRTSVSTRAFLESRATITILLLVITFVSFYTMSCIYQISLSVIYNPSPVLHHIGVFAMSCFPSLSPFLLMSGHSTSCSLFFTCTKKKKVVLP